METLNIIQSLAKPRKSEKKHHNGKGKNFSGRKTDIKKLVKTKTINKTPKEQYIDLLGSNIDAFQNEIKKFYMGKSKVFEDRAELVDLFTNKKFAKYLCAAIEEANNTPYPIFFVIGDMLVNEDTAFVEDEKLCKRYFKLFNEFEEEKIKKVAKAFGCKKSVALGLLLTVTSYKDCRMKFMVKRYLAFLDGLYAIEGLTEKKVIKGLKTCFGKRIQYFLSVALTEKPQNNETFSIVTNAILAIINKMDTSDAKELLRDYSKKRAKYPNGKRRLNFFTINQDDYKTIFKVINRLIDTGFNKETFL